VQHFVSASTVGPKTTANICITLQSLWRTAKVWRYATSDVLSGVVLAAQKRVQRFFLSESEIHLIISVAAEPYKTFYGLLAETGLRVGELCGLTVEDIDLGRNILQVRQSAWRGRLGDPKTNESIRVVEISPRAAEHLGGYLQTWRPNEQRLLFASHAFRHANATLMSSWCITEIKSATWTALRLRNLSTRRLSVKMDAVSPRSLEMQFGAEFWM
jgi:integrase